MEGSFVYRLIVPNPDLEGPIAARIDAGDLRGAAEGLVLAYGSEVLGRCSNLVRDRVLAEDLAQDVFSRAFAGLAHFRGESSLRTWLFTIVRNVCVDHHRRQAASPWQRDPDVDLEDQPDERRLLVEMMVDGDRLQRALATLEESDRALVLLRHVHGLEYAELAETFGIQEGAVRMRLCRALARMRDQLAPAVPRRSATRRAAAPLSESAPRYASPEWLAEGSRRRAVEAPTAPEIRKPGGAEERGAVYGAIELPAAGAPASSHAPSPDPLGRAFGLLLAGSEPRPTVTELFARLGREIARLSGPSEPAHAKRSWLARLFDRR